MVSGKKGFERRSGRGFSRGELKEAGVNLHQAMKIDVAVDRRRRSVNSKNVELLKTQMQSHAAAENPSPKPKRARKKVE